MKKVMKKKSYRDTVSILTLKMPEFSLFCAPGTLFGQISTTILMQAIDRENVKQNYRTMNDVAMLTLSF